MKAKNSAKIFFLVLLIFANSTKLFSQQGGLRSFGIFYDEDQTLDWTALHKLNDDRNYTLGLGFYLSCPKLHISPVFAPLKKLNSLLGLKNNNGKEAVRSFLLANGSFTPDKIDTAGVIYDDRPYGSITYFQTTTSYTDNERFINDKTKLSIGLIGTYIAREAQTFVHKLGNWNLPQGWHNQISNKWEPTFLFSYSGERLLNRSSVTNTLANKWGVEAKAGWGTDVGYYTNVHGEFSFRAGQIDPRNWSYDAMPLSGSSMFAKHAIPDSKHTSPSPFSEIYFAGSVRPYFILYNALLNGQFKKSINVLNFTETKHFMVEFNGGLGTNIIHGRHNNHALDIQFKINGRTPEFKTATRPQRWHLWGSLNLICSRW